MAKYKDRWWKSNKSLQILIKTRFLKLLFTNKYLNKILFYYKNLYFGDW